MAKKEEQNWSRWYTRIPSEDQNRVHELFIRSGAKTKSAYLRTKLLRENFKVILADSSKRPAERALKEVLAEIQRIGIEYNLLVRKMNSYYSLSFMRQSFTQIASWQKALIAQVLITKETFTQAKTLIEAKIYDPRETKKDKTHDWSRCDIRISAEERSRVVELYILSGIESKSEYLRNRLLCDKFKVEVIQREEIILRRAVEAILFALKKIGVNYNQAIRVINKHHQAIIAKGISRINEELQQNLLVELSSLRQLI